MALFTGSGVALVTPYKDTYKKEVNFEVLEQLITFQIENGTDALVIDGTTGEASTQTDEEQIRVIAFAVEKTKGRVPVIAGAGSNDTAHGVNLSKACQDVGADAILSVTPYYLKTSQSGLVAHYKAIAEAVDIPMLVYDVPGRTGMTIAAETYHELMSISNIVGVKDATNNFNKVVDIVHVTKGNLDLYSGNDDTVIPLMSMGAKGVISVLANIMPKYVHDMATAALNGDYETARTMQADAKPLIDALFMEPSPMPIKTAMNLMGFNVGPTRLPLTTPQEQTVVALKRELHRFDLI